MLESAILQNQQQQWPPLWPDVKSSKVVSTGRATTDNAHLWSWFTVRKHKVYSALKWLVQNHVTIHEQMMSAWEFAFVAVELFYSIARDWEPSAEDASRDGFGMTHECAWCDDTAGDLLLRLLESFTWIILLRSSTAPHWPVQLAQLKNDITIMPLRVRKF
jgi:hypothetical protein